MKRIIYIANIRLPTEKAHGIQIMKMCEALALCGNEVELLIPRRLNSIKEDPFEYYKVRKIFKISRLPCIDLISWFGRFGYMLENLSFAESVFWRVLTRKGKRDHIFYSRDELALFYLSNIGLRCVWESHMGHLNIFSRALIRRRTKIISITNGLKDYYVRHGSQSHDVLVSPDGVDLDQFNLPLLLEEARRKINFSTDDRVALYTGQLYQWKGADTLALASRHLPTSVSVVFVGGTERHIKDFHNRYGTHENIFILGKKPHHEIPIYLKSADLLVVPNSAKEDISKLYTSPLKLFEYMASRVPIIASDLPSLREIVDESMVFFFKPDDAEDLARVIKEALSHYEVAKNRAQKAFAKVQGYSWQKRAEKILTFIS